jgi:MFS family permease
LLSRISTMSEAKLTLPYYGWYVLAGSALCEMLLQGATSYGAGLFVLPLQAEFGLSRANASSPILILFVGAVFVAPIAGRILDRVPIRVSVMAGVFCFSLALAVIALTGSLWLMALMVLAPLAMSLGLLGPMNTATLASRWFFRRRGLALGIAAIATSGGGLLVVPFLSKAIELYGWRPALLLEAAVFFVIIAALALWVLRDNPFKAGYGENPENKGRTDREALMATDRSVAPQADSSWRKVMGHPGFWAPSLMLAAISSIAQVIVVSMPAYGHQLGYGAAASAFLISAFSLAAALTKILAGVMADFWDKRVLLFATAIFMPLALGVFCLLSSYTALVAACAMAGVALGGVLPLSSGLLAARFGVARFGTVIGWTYMLLSFSVIVAVRFAGTVFDRTGSYRGAFEGLLLAALLVALCSIILDLRQKPAP